MKTIVLGASGQLGQCLKLAASKRGFADIIFPDEAEANILETSLLQKLFEQEAPSFVINCAAYTAVDKAEDEQELSRNINARGVANISYLCSLFNSTLVHVSTDFVFKGDTPMLLTEEDKTEPINIYGITKLEGEQIIAKALEKYLIIRTSWLYSEYGNNFVKTMLRLGKERDELGVIIDQVGSPTYAVDLANAILDMIEAPNIVYGIYHYSNEGITSWYDFAKAIFDLSNINTQLKPLKTTEYITKASRPYFSVMDKSKIKNTYGLKIPYWRDSLKICLEKIV